MKSPVIIGLFVGSCYNSFTIYGRVRVNIMDKLLQKNKRKTDELLHCIELQKSEIKELHDTNESNQLSIEHLTLRLKLLQEKFHLAQHSRFGKKSEAFHAAQGDLFDDLIEEPDESTATDEVFEKETITYTRKKKTKGRNIDTSNLPREQVTHDLTDAEKCCAGCSNEMKQIGEDRKEILEHIPETIKVIEHVTLKYACADCNSIKQAKAPAAPIPKSMASSSLLSEIIISKYENHIPLYRRSKIFAKQGIDIPDNTLGNWVMQSGEIFAPLGEALWEQLQIIYYLQADETPVKVLADNKKGYMWCYHSLDKDNRFVIFDYNLSRSGAVVQARLKDFKGLIQTDGYSGYNYFRKLEDVINFGCWDHARRKFVEAQRVSGKKEKGLAAKAINAIGKLYRIETEIKSLPSEERKQVRQIKSKPILEALHQWLLENNRKVPKRSNLGTAFTYALNQWCYLINYIDHGEAQISNCLVENLIRPFAIGRRNWLFVGNERGGKVAALLYSLIQSCIINKINARKYLTYVLNQAHLIRREQIDIKSLLPQFISKELVA